MMAASSTIPFSKFSQIKAAQRVIRDEAAALLRLADQLPSSFDEAVDLLHECRGCVIVSGIGKAGWIGQKISASLASTGTRSHYLHASEAVHGDLGRIGPDDVLLMLSNSGETPEVLQLLPTLAKLRVPVIAIVAREDCTLARRATVVLSYGSHREACALGLAPSTSTALMLALGDALTLVASERKGFQATDFAKFHPGGSLGLKLSRVDDIMRSAEACRMTLDHQSIRQVYVHCHLPGRRSGAILLTDAQGRLTGLFTDSDLARILENERDDLLDRPISEVMTKNPITAKSGTQVTMAIDQMACHNISELPVVDAAGKPIGIIDITDVVSFLPR